MKPVIFYFPRGFFVAGGMGDMILKFGDMIILGVVGDKEYYCTFSTKIFGLEKTLPRALHA